MCWLPFLSVVLIRFFKSHCVDEAGNKMDFVLTVLYPIAHFSTDGSQPAAFPARKFLQTIEAGLHSARFFKSARRTATGLPSILAAWMAVIQ